jgi:hypothetical protein
LAALRDGQTGFVVDRAIVGSADGADVENGKVLRKFLAKSQIKLTLIESQQIAASRTALHRRQCF